MGKTPPFVRRRPPFASVEVAQVYRARCPDCKTVNNLTKQAYAFARHTCAACEQEYLIRPEGMTA